MSTVAEFARHLTVTVHCRLPNGFKLEIPDAEPTQRRSGTFFILRGTDNSRGIVDGYALTRGIPKDFWIEWCRLNKDSLLLTDHIIFAEPG